MTDVHVLVSVLVLLFVTVHASEFTLASLVSVHPAFYTIRWDVNAAASRMCLNKLESEGILEKNFIRLVTIPIECNANVTAGEIIDVMNKYQINGLVGLACSFAAIEAAYMSAYYNIPMIGQVSTNPAMQDKTSFPNLVRIFPPSNKLISSVAEIFKYYKWRKVVAISRSSGLCYNNALTISEQFPMINISVAKWLQSKGKAMTEDEARAFLAIIKLNSRVIFFCGSEEETEIFLSLAVEMNMVGPDYVYICSKIIPIYPLTSPWTTRNDTRAMNVLKAAPSVIEIALEPVSSQAVKDFQVEHPQKMLEYFNESVTREGSIYSIYLCDAVYMMAHAINKTIESGRNITDGRAIIEAARTLQFHGLSGHVSLDDNGDRWPDYDLWYLPPGTETLVKFAVVALRLEDGKRMHIVAPHIWRTEDGLPPPDTPKCGFTGEFCIVPDYTQTWIIVGCSVLALCILVTAVVSGFIMWRRKFEESLLRMIWKVQYEDLHFMKVKQPGTSTGSISQYGSQISTRFHKQDKDVDLYGAHSIVAVYGGQMVTVKKMNMASVTLTRADQVELQMMKNLRHDNINTFAGLTIDPGTVCMLAAYHPKGSLQDVLLNDDLNLDEMFKISFIADLVNGITFLHSSQIKSHGSLKSSNCVLNKRWVLKITDCRPTCLGVAKDRLEEQETQKRKLWDAPEFLRMNELPIRGSPEGDIYSLGIIIHEICYKTTAFNRSNLTSKDIVRRVKKLENPPFRPCIPTDVGGVANMKDLMTTCWTEEPEYRPNAITIKNKIKDFTAGTKVDIMDKMLVKLTKYADNLEELVYHRTEELFIEKRKTDMLLYRMLPPSIAETLKQGHVIVPETFEEVTIYFSDIVGFTGICAQSSPLEVINLLNDLYQTFDAIITKHDVYKVETIGDAYMVVSGLPMSNGHMHAGEIANMALNVLDAIGTFEIRHKPGQKLMSRIGIHTGSCCAGVVGAAMPRYCLFGDTVNTASRMESHGEANRIHLSQAAYTALSCLNAGYKISERGEIPIKGKGIQMTYWLDGRFLTGEETDI